MTSEDVSVRREPLNANCRRLPVPLGNTRIVRAVVASHRIDSGSANAYTVLPAEIATNCRPPIA
jgi:hypothetical protein